jgi:hypothetical protein
VGSGKVPGVSTVGGRVGVEVDDDAAQPVNRRTAIHEINVLFIFISVHKYT